jgi:octanoyl-[GcvH]:protein N-octanoyltransferase
VLRVYAPAPTLAFGRLDALRPGFDRAALAAAARGFTPVIRVAGGHAAAYHGGCLVVDEIAHDPDALAGMQERFRVGAEQLAQALRELGVDARVGELPGEYCPGEYSINARGRVKLAGTAQRVVRDAWLRSTVLVATDAGPLRDVLVDVYAELAMPFDPATAHAVADEVAGVTAGDLARVVAAAHGARDALVPAPLEDDVLEEARRLLDRHRWTPRAA